VRRSGTTLLERRKTAGIMFVGHIGAGLLVKRIEPRLNLGVVMFVALFADLLLWTLVILDVEHVGVPESAGPARFFTFVFPYSHGLVANIVWSALAAAIGWYFVAPADSCRARFAWALALAVSSHFMLDLIVHIPDLPIFNRNSPKVGLGLWRHMPIALALELCLSAVALAIYLRAVKPTRGKVFLIGGVVVVAAALTTIGPYIPGEPPPAVTLALSSLLILVVVVILGFVVEGRVKVVVEHQVRPKPEPGRL
jgi:hypothetical protein